jgi:GGDEF domain-containing protein
MAAHLTYGRQTEPREQIAVDEPPTGLLTRSAGLAALAASIDLVRQSPVPQLTLALLAVDDLNAIDELRGPRYADGMLLAVATLLRQRARRRYDLVFRYSRGEFVSAMPFLDLGRASTLLFEVWRAFKGEHMQSFRVGFADLREGDDAARLITRAAYCLRGARLRNWQAAT